MAGPVPHPHAIDPAAQEAFDAGTREFVLGDDAAAITHLRMAVAAHADFADAHYMLGLALVRHGDVEGGIEALSAAAETTPNAILREYAQKKVASVRAAAAVGEGEGPG